MSENEKILPCPFCGKVPILEKHEYWEQDEYTITCPCYDCPMDMETPDKDKLIKAWNKRPLMEEAFQKGFMEGRFDSPHMSDEDTRLISQYFQDFLKEKMDE